MKVADRKRVAGDIGTILPQHFKGVLDFIAAAKAAVVFIFIFSWM